MTPTTPPVTVTPVVLTRALYDTLLRSIATEEFEYGKHSDLDEARRWLHYRWLVEQSTQGEKTE